MRRSASRPTRRAPAAQRLHAVDLPHATRVGAVNADGSVDGPSRFAESARSSSSQTAVCQTPTPEGMLDIQDAAAFLESWLMGRTAGHDGAGSLHRKIEAAWPSPIETHGGQRRLARGGRTNLLRDHGESPGRRRDRTAPSLRACANPSRWRRTVHCRRVPTTGR